MSRGSFHGALYYTGVGLFAAALGAVWGLGAIFLVGLFHELPNRQALLYVGLPVALVMALLIFRNAGSLFGPREGELSFTRTSAPFEGPYRSGEPGKFRSALEGTGFIMECLGLLALIVFAAVSGYDWLAHGQYLKFGIVFGIAIVSVILGFRNSWFLLGLGFAAFVAGVFP